MKIGIIAASHFEIDIIKNTVENPKTKLIADQEFVYGSINNCEVVLMQCGMGKVSAALGTQILISEFKPDYIINTGCAGALSNKLNVGDFVLSEKTIEWDLDTIDIGNPRGYVTSLNRVEMDADKKLVEMIEKIIKDEKIYKGLIVSGDQFVSKKSQRELILNAFPQALCTEMEGAAVGHVCYTNKVPFCVIRAMSDNANGDSGVDYATFSCQVSEKVASYLIEFLKTI